MEEEYMKSKLEKRIGAFCRQKKSINNLDDLKKEFEESGNILENVRNQFPVKYVRKWVDWDKLEGLYKKSTNVLIGDCGDYMLKEWQVIEKTRQLPDEEFGKKLPEIVAETYGSLDNYEAYGASLKDCSKKLYTMLNEAKFSLIEKLTLKQACKMLINALGKTGQEIIAAAEEAQGHYGLKTLGKMLRKSLENKNKYGG